LESKKRESSDLKKGPKNEGGDSGTHGVVEKIDCGPRRLRSGRFRTKFQMQKGETGGRGTLILVWGPSPTAAEEIGGQKK